MLHHSIFHLHIFSNRKVEHIFMCLKTFVSLWVFFSVNYSYSFVDFPFRAIGLVWFVLLFVSKSSLYIMEIGRLSVI